MEQDNNKLYLRDMQKMKKKKKLAYKVILEKEKKIKRGVQEKLLKFEQGKLQELLNEAHLQNIDEEVEQRYKQILELYYKKFDKQAKNFKERKENMANMFVSSVDSLDLGGSIQP